MSTPDSSTVQITNYPRQTKAGTDLVNMSEKNVC